MFCIKSGDTVFVGKDAVCIDTGTSGGIIEAVPSCVDASFPIGNKTPRLFVVEEMSSRFRFLLPVASGFIFRTGNNLSHFANIIRYNHIPACISEELWKAAVSLDGERCEFRSEELPNYPEDVTAEYVYNYSSYCAQLEKDMCLPVYDVYNKKLSPDGEETGFKIGQKALSISYLASRGCRMPDTLLLGNFHPSYYAADEECIGAVIRHFKSTGSELPGLFIRPSLWTSPFSKCFVSGIMSSKSASGRDGLSQRINALLCDRRKLPFSTEECSLSIVIQEHIPVKFFGLLFTRLPWDYLSSKLILQLRPGEGGQGCGLTAQITAGIPDPAIPVSQEYIMNNIRPKVDPALMDGIFTDSFCLALAGFMTECFDLCSRLSIPLEVEFIVDQNDSFVFIQFREIFRDLKK